MNTYYVLDLILQVLENISEQNEVLVWTLYSNGAERPYTIDIIHYIVC